MNLSIGIVGLPNIGKSTLFNALLKKTVADAANYPFCTIEPNVGVVEVPDDRLPKIANIVNTQKVVPAVVEFYDIAGLVAGASQGEGLGNKFLSHIREVATIAHVVRLFEDDNVLHVSNSVDPVRDILIIQTELVLSDLATLEKQKDLSIAARAKATKEEGVRADVVIKLKNHLNAGNPARTLSLTDDEAEAAQELHLLTMKPVIYVFNVSENQLTDKNALEEKIHSIMNKINQVSSNESLHPTNNDNTIYLNAKLENEVLALDDLEQKEYLSQYGLEETGLNRLIKKAYETLGLISFLTGGELEARAWTIKKDTLAPKAAAAIHTDFEKKFIKADIVPYTTFIEVGGWTKAREAGKVQIVGKDYVMRDGDVVEFKIGG
jgi:hypothetical protein